MNCSPDLIEAYLDEELDASLRAAVEQHLAVCLDCSGAFARLRMQKAAIKADAPYYDAPPDLHRAVYDALQRTVSEKATLPARATPWRLVAVAASLLLAISVAWNLFQLRPRSVQSDLAGIVLTNHIRSLLGTHLMDVASSDRHTVKPWFAGKLDFSPDVKDLGVEGFPLAGGRIEYLAGRRVAALVYYRRQHVINLFIWPGKSPAEGEAGLSRDGYHLVHWNDAAMTYWAVSDVSLPDLETFRSLYSGGLSGNRKPGNRKQ